MKNILLPLAAFCLLSIPNPVLSENKVVNGVEYQKISGKWHRIDTNDERWKIAPGELVVRFKTATTEKTRLLFARDSNLEARRILPSAAGFYRFRYEKTSDPISVLESVLTRPSVADASLDTYLKFLGAPNDMFYADHQWNLRKIGLERAWEITTGSPDVTIAVIDGGVEYDHEDLYETLWSNPNEIPGDGIDNDADSLWYGEPLIDDTIG